MRVRTFVTILLLLVVLWGIAAMWTANRDVLAHTVYLWGETTTTVGWLLIAFLALGVLGTILLGGVRELSLMIERSRLRKVGRKYEEIEDEYSRGLVADLEGREEEALAHFRKTLEWDSKHFNTLIKIGEVLRSQERVAEAIEYHRKAHHLKEDSPRPLYALVEDYEARGDMDQARAVLGQIIAIDKNSVAAWRKLRSIHVKERHWEPALEAHDRVVRLHAPNDPQAPADRRTGRGIRYEIASERLARGKVREAIGLLRRLIKDDPTFIPAHVKLGHALQKQGHETEATEAWFSGFEATGSPIFLTVLEEHFLKREEPFAAIEALKRCIGASRKDTLARFYLGKLYFRLEMLDDAFTVLSALRGRASYAPTLHYLLGRINERRNHHSAANEEYRHVIKEMDLVQLEYLCQACDATLIEWSDRCPRCGEWQSVEVNFREEISLDELGLSAAPIYPSRP
ncbi:MAG TPA: tetratricopeptide repeat protein [Candidatus Polarisedimenticolaceae bacterium]|nr:tetratricopeptide repeat protein [Candidatus Polarisedimenticolaceae bacterium]